MKSLKEILIVIVCLSILSCSGQSSKEEQNRIDRTQIIEHLRDSISKVFLENNIATNMLRVVPTKMNVLYIGVDNPLSINFPNINPEDICVIATNGCIKRNPKSGYIIKPRHTGSCIVSAHTVINGKKKNLGMQRFKARKLPKPVAYVAGKMSGRINKNVLLSQKGVYARIENTDFNVIYNVVEFVVSTVSRGYNISYKSSSAYFTGPQKDCMRRLRRGQKLIIDNIKVVGHDGSIQCISPISLEIQ